MHTYIFAWVLQDAQRYAQPHPYEHEQGAFVWAFICIEKCVQQMDVWHCGKKIV